MMQELVGLWLMIGLAGWENSPTDGGRVIVFAKGASWVHANFVGTREEEKEDIPDKKRKSPLIRKEGAKR